MKEADIACIFDMDGVLVDTARYHYKSWIKLADSLGFALSPKLEEELKGINRMKSLEIVLKSGGLQATDAQKLEYTKQKNQWFLDSLGVISDDVILPGVKTFLDQLKELGIPMSVGSASENANYLLTKLGMKGYFVSIVDALCVRHIKPHPEVFLNAARDLQYPPCRIIVFEDSQKGLQAANTGGFHSVGIGSPETLKDAGMVIQNFENKSFGKIKVALGIT